MIAFAQDIIYRLISEIPEPALLEDKTNPDGLPTKIYDTFLLFIELNLPTPIQKALKIVRKKPEIIGYNIKRHKMFPSC